MDNASPSTFIKINHWKRYAWAKILGGIGFVVGFIGGICVLIGIVLFVSETVEWMRLGTWNRTTVAHEFYRSLSSSTQAWIKAPDSWYGFWRIVNQVGSWSAWWVYLLLSIPLLCASAVLITISDTNSEQLSEERKPKESTSIDEMSGAELMQIIRGDHEEDQANTRKPL